MNTNFNEIKETEKLLQEGRYDLCSIKCGMIIETMFRNLLENYIKKITEQDLKLLKTHLPPSKKSIDHLTLGELTILFEKYNGLRNFIRKHLSIQNEISFFDLNPVIVKIRNIAVHNNYKDLDAKKADAHIIYGSLLRLCSLELFRSNVYTPNIKEDVLKPSIKTSETPKVSVTVNPKEVSENDSINQIPSILIEEKYLTVLRNNTSEKYFIFIEYDCSNKNKALLVHPSGIVHSYALNMFNEPEEMKTELLLKRGFVKKKQYQQYINFKQNVDTKSLEGLNISKNIHSKTVTNQRSSEKKRVFPRGCTVDGTHYDSANEAVIALIRRGKLQKSDLPQSEYNAHAWLQRKMNHFNFSYKRDT